MKSKIVILVLFTVIILTNYLFPADLKILKREAPPGNIVYVPVTVSDAQTLAGIELVLQFDPAYMDFLGIDRESVIQGFFIVDTCKNNKIAVSLACSTGMIHSNATLFEMMFRIKSSVQIGTATDIFWIEANLFDEDTEPIPVETEDGVIKVSEFSVFPNPFTPNDDGFNDRVNFIIPDSVASEVVIKIFGIKGNRIKEISRSTDTILQWDGFDENNHLMQPGVYLYVISRNGDLVHKGTITLMR
jgi:gliding motility-associated-like protein